MWKFLKILFLLAFMSNPLDILPERYDEFFKNTPDRFYLTFTNLSSSQDQTTNIFDIDKTKVASSTWVYKIPTASFNSFGVLHSLVIGGTTYTVSVAATTAGALLTALNNQFGTAGSTLVVGTWTNYVDGVNQVFYVQSGSTLGTLSYTNVNLGPLTVQPNPFLIAYNPQMNRMYVSCDGGTGDQVSVIDCATNTIIANITAGNSPEGLAYNPLTNTMYVANRSDNTVVVIDCTTNTITATISGFSLPVGIAYDSVDNRMYVSNQSGGNTVSVISCSSNTITATITATGVNNSEILVYDSTNNRMYVPCGSQNTVVVIDCASNTVLTTITGFNSASGGAYRSSNNSIYIVQKGANPVQIIDCASNTISGSIAIASFGSAGLIVYHSTDDTMYISNPSTNNKTIYVISCATNTLTQSLVQTGVTNPGFEGLAWDTADDRIYFVADNKTTLNAFIIYVTNPDLQFGPTTSSTCLYGTTVQVTGSLSYNELNNMQLGGAYKINRMFSQSPSENQLLQTLDIRYKDGFGDLTDHFAVPVIDPYQKNAISTTPIDFEDFILNTDTLIKNYTFLAGQNITMLFDYTKAAPFDFHIAESPNNEDDQGGRKAEIMPPRGKEMRLTPNMWDDIY